MVVCSISKCTSNSDDEAQLFDTRPVLLVGNRKIDKFSPTQPKTPTLGNIQNEAAVALSLELSVWWMTKQAGLGIMWDNSSANPNFDSLILPSSIPSSFVIDSDFTTAFDYQLFPLSPYFRATETSSTCYYNSCVGIWAVSGKCSISRLSSAHSSAVSNPTHDNVRCSRVQISQ